MYRADFGASLKPPPAVTAFRFKASAKPKAKKVAGKGKPAAAAAPAAGSRAGQRCHRRSDLRRQAHARRYPSP